MPYFPAFGGGTSVTGNRNLLGTSSVGAVTNIPYTDVLSADPVQYRNKVPIANSVGNLPIVGGDGNVGNAAHLQDVLNATNAKPQIVALSGASTAAQIVSALQA